VRVSVSAISMRMSAPISGEPARVFESGHAQAMSVCCSTSITFLRWRDVIVAEQSVRRAGLGGVTAGLGRVLTLSTPVCSICTDRFLAPDAICITAREQTVDSASDASGERRDVLVRRRRQRNESRACHGFARAKRPRPRQNTLCKIWRTDCLRLTPDAATVTSSGRPIRLYALAVSEIDQGMDVALRGCMTNIAPEDLETVCGG